MVTVRTAQSPDITRRWNVVVESSRQETAIGHPQSPRLEVRGSKDDTSARRLGQDAPERDRLLATKLTAPRPRSERLSRSRPIARLDEGMARDLVLVCTPAGFGKTTLLAEWARSAECPVAWLSLDPDDNDPVRFWRYVLAALGRAGVPVHDRLLSLLSPPNVASSHGVAAALVNELEALPDEVALVLDDYHLIESAMIHDGIAFLVGHLPRQLHVVIASRSDPPLPLARLRASDRLAELRGSDLRFTPEESAAFVRDVWDLDLSPAVIAALETRTEGWAVGLQLAALSLQGRRDPEAFLDAFTGTHRFVLDYLSEEVLECQPEAVRTFLLRTSILDRLSGPLCDAVTATAGGQAMLEYLERVNLFLVPLDDERRWYRFHRLFGDLLRARLQQSAPNMMPELHRRAAIWCETNGLLDDAIHHSLESRDPLRAATLVEQHLDDLLRRGEQASLWRWLTLIREDEVRSRPRLCLAQAMVALNFGRFEVVQRLLDHAERTFHLDDRSQAPDIPVEGGMLASLPAAIAMLRTGLAACAGDPNRARELARSALARLPEEARGPRLWARFHLALAHWMRGDLREADRELADLLKEGWSAPDYHPLGTARYTLGRVQRARGELRAAGRTFRLGLQLAPSAGPQFPLKAGEAHVGIARILYERDELDDALAHVIDGVGLCRELWYTQLLATGLATLAWIRQALGDPHRAREAIEEVGTVLGGVEVVTLLDPGPAEGARLALAQGRLEDAVRFTEERGIAQEDDPTYAREGDYLVLARVLLARSEPDRALGLLDRLDALAESQGRMGSVIEIRVLRALALQARGDHERALSALADALGLARPRGYVRVFADEGPPLAALLKSLIGARRRGLVPTVSGAAQEHVNRVVRAFPPLGGEAPAPAAGLIEPLTAREREVLGLIAAGKRNHDIAVELVVTLDTVKKHVSHIFDKLGATTRTEAVRNARELGLVS